jgi:hypothetical protein
MLSDWPHHLHSVGSDHTAMKCLYTNSCIFPAVEGEDYCPSHGRMVELMAAAPSARVSEPEYKPARRHTGPKPKITLRTKRKTRSGSYAEKIRPCI